MSIKVLFMSQLLQEPPVETGALVGYYAATCHPLGGGGLKSRSLAYGD